MPSYVAYLHYICINYQYIILLEQKRAHYMDADDRGDLSHILFGYTEP
jgi:hypothetical protein